MNDLNKLSFYRADLTNISSLVDLINAAYRQKNENTWTTEADLVLGARISSSQLLQQLQNSHFHLLVAEQNNQVVACIGLTFDTLSVEIGTFAISPDWQNQGLGKLVLDYAEKYATDVQSDLKTYVMWVLNVRTELIAFYARRGYVQTGVMEDYPLDADVGIPQVNLCLIEMRKAAS
ncbi:GNAT family N-acetyltransferase [Acinetobacter sichuanensis]|uniref:N-acetyltransferase n=1 Tax=Acinetobacter sichuanensis TaxID=2136183 RepID=A0A371YNU6_9GAMM|nr:GNAT family N-acetyltransferase [Acinetobacter sichuanensis]RFC83151.1 N-acetyltransferase [Acinetobacter sichuanensis]